MEDDVHLTEILRVHLRSEGDAVEHAADGRQDLALVERDRGQAIIRRLLLAGRQIITS